MIAKPQNTVWRFADARDYATLETSALHVRVDKATGAVQFFDAAGQPVLVEIQNGSALTPATIGPSTPLRAGGASTWRVRQTFELAPDEGIYGLGQHPDGFMNHRGTTSTGSRKTGLSACPCWC